ncbi:MAG: hypothetical protein JJU11_00740 [Candidatus Sumerlaeia bacterium]|nr:hypothetical protein [Candidatus Sumerlaeia bacterium]
MAEGQASEEKLLEEVKSLNKRLDDVNQAVAQSKLAARGVMVALFLVVIFGIWNAFRPAYVAYQNPEPYREAFLEELQSTILPLLESEVKDIAQTTGREVFNLAVEKAQGRSDDLAKAFELEVGNLMQELQEYGEDTLAKQVVTFELAIREKLSDALGEDIEDENLMIRVLDNAALAVENAVRRSVDKELADHINEIIRLEELMVNFPVPMEIKEMDDTQLSEFMISELGRYAVATLKVNFTTEQRELLRELSD